MRAPLRKAARMRNAAEFPAPYTRNYGAAEATLLSVACSATVVYPRQMDREKLRRYLNQTEKHIASSNQLVTDQRALIARLEERGYDTAQSKTTLAHLEQMRELHIADRDRLSRMLSELGE
jgi:hypothetical protein